MSLENLNEQTHPEDYARARKMLEDCDWQLDRDDVAVYSVCEDVVISTMIHFRDSETEALPEVVRQLRADAERERQFICRKCGLRQELGEKPEVTF